MYLTQLRQVAPRLSLLLAQARQGQPWSRLLPFDVGFERRKVMHIRKTNEEQAALMAIAEWCYANSEHLPPEEPGVVERRQTRHLRHLEFFKQRLKEEEEKNLDQEQLEWRR